MNRTAKELQAPRHIASALHQLLVEESVLRDVQSPVSARVGDGSIDRILTSLARSLGYRIERVAAETEKAAA